MSDAEWEEEVKTDVALAAALVASQFEAWADLPIFQVEAASTDNTIFRLGPEMAIRLPRRASATASIEKEHAWLPKLAPSLPVPIPLPLALGSPGGGYPYAWSVVQWLEGSSPETSEQADARLACDLAAFLTTLRGLDATDGPPAGAHNHWRGAPLQAFDREMRRRFEWLADADDIGHIVSAWDRSLDAAPWEGSPAWIHGDLKGANLLCRADALSGVLDWSLAGVGDPACDIAVAWTLFDGDARIAFRRAAGIDDATWDRGRAWALIDGVLGLSYYRNLNVELANGGRRVIERVLAD